MPMMADLVTRHHALQPCCNHSALCLPVDYPRQQLQPVDATCFRKRGQGGGMIVKPHAFPRLHAMITRP